MHQRLVSTACSDTPPYLYIQKRYLVHGCFRQYFARQKLSREEGGGLKLPVEQSFPELSDLDTMRSLRNPAIRGIVERLPHAQLSNPAIRDLNMSHTSTFGGMVKRGLPAIMRTSGCVRMHTISNVARCTGLPRHTASLLVCHVCILPRFYGTFGDRVAGHVDAQS